MPTNSTHSTATVPSGARSAFKGQSGKTAYAQPLFQNLHI